MDKQLLIIASILGALGIALGAFGAHGLRKIVNVDTLATFQTGVQYHMYHVFAILAAAILAERFGVNLFIYSGYLFLAGILLFSGSLYLAVSIEAMKGSVPVFVSLITPIGGLLFIAGWVLLLMGAIRK
jgi:uncharacterized membrane protein YgdD (TMEM256/DUF423 family)